MSSFEPNTRHLRELLIYFFNLKKSAIEAHRLLVETYGVKVYKDADLEALYNDSSYAQLFAALVANVHHLCINMRDHTLQ